MDTFRCDVNIHFNIRNCFFNARLRAWTKARQQKSSKEAKGANEYRGESFASCVTLKIASFPNMEDTYTLKCHVLMYDIM